MAMSILAISSAWRIAKGPIGVSKCGGSELRAVVVMVIVTVAPAMAGFGVNVTWVPCGRPVAARVTEFEKPLLEGAIIIVNCAGCPAGTVAVLVDTVGVKLSATKGCPADVPPPGAGFVTVTCRLPPSALSEAGTVVVNCEALTNVVVSALPLKLTTAPETKFVPVTVSIEMAAPALACAGDSEVTVGAGLPTATAAEAITDVPAAFVTVKVKVVVEVGVTVFAIPLPTGPTPLSTEAVPLLNTAVKVVELPAAIVADAAVKLLMTGAGTMARVKFWTASLPIPFWALNVRLYVPLLPTAGVPDNTPVEVSNDIPLGSVPVSTKVGVGLPVAVTVNDPNAPAVSVALFPLVMTGAVFVTTTAEPQIEPAQA